MAISDETEPEMDADDSGGAGEGMGKNTYTVLGGADQ